MENTTLINTIKSKCDWWYDILYLYKRKSSSSKLRVSFTSKYGYAKCSSLAAMSSMKIDEVICSGLQIFSLINVSYDFPPMTSATWPAIMYIKLLYPQTSRNGCACGKYFSRLELHRYMIPFLYNWLLSIRPKTPNNKSIKKINNSQWRKNYVYQYCQSKQWIW